MNLQYEFSRSWVLEVGYVGDPAPINLLDQYHSVNNPLIASPSNPINGITVNTVANAESACAISRLYAARRLIQLPSRRELELQ